MTLERTLIAMGLATALAGASTTAGAAQGSAALAGLNTAEAPRVSATVDNSRLTSLAHTHVEAISRGHRTGAVEDSLSMPHMQLILRPSARRQAALKTLIADQHDPASAKYHQWLSPTEYGANFGVTDADINAVTSWLASQGFKVNGVATNRSQVDFSGNAGLVRRAFHTQVGRYSLTTTAGAEDHVANDADISVPAALADVVVGVAGLNDFHPRHMGHWQVGQYDKASNTYAVKKASDAPENVQAKASIRQAIGFTNGERGLVPFDMQTIYNVAPLHQTGLTGKGITVAVVEDAAMVPGDWTNFVSQFSLGGQGGSFKQFFPQPASGSTNCTDPGGETADTESIETVLDSEYVTALAPGAKVWVAACSDSATNNFFGGVYIAASNLINNPDAAGRPNIISASYGYGELNVDAASKTAIDAMWAQADAEGISVFVSSGDSGSNPSFNGDIINGDTGGVDANAFASSANDTAVGGTDTADVLQGTTSKYFNKKPNALYGTAKSYVPEITWNESCGNDYAAAQVFGQSVEKTCKNLLLYGGSNGATSEGGSGGPSSIVAKPTWQRIVRGATKDQFRDVPDISLFGGSFGDATWAVLCTASYPCAPDFTTPTVLEGGTSLSAPMFAGIQAVLNQGLMQAGSPSANQGNPAPTLYQLAATEFGGPTGTVPATLAACDAINGSKGSGKCVFHNITAGGNASNCAELTSILGIPLDPVDTPNCYIYGTGTVYGELATANVGLTSLSTAKFKPAYPAQAGWSFANGLGSVNAANLLAAWKKFDGLK